MHVAPTTELKALLRLAGPLIASQLAHMLMVLTDTLMMARISPQALAGGGLGAASYSFVSIFCLGVIAAVGTLVAIRKGANDIEGVTRLAQSGLWLAWGLALVAALVLWNLQPVLLMFGQQPENVASAAEFLTLLPLALPSYLTFMALRGFTSALGRSTPVMVISVIGTVLNYLLNVALIEGMFGLPKLGLMGIGLVTAVVSLGMAIALALYIRWHSAYAPYPLRKGLSRPSLPALRELWRLGLPIGGTYMVEVGLFAFAALCMGVLGSTELAAHQIALQIVSTAFMVPTGLSYAVTMRVGLYYGGGNLLAARSAGRVGIGFGGMIMFAFAALCMGCHSCSDDVHALDLIRQWPDDLDSRYGQQLAHLLQTDLRLTIAQCITHQCGRCDRHSLLPQLLGDAHLRKHHVDRVNPTDPTGNRDGLCRQQRPPQPLGGGDIGAGSPVLHRQPQM